MRVSNSRKVAARATLSITTLWSMGTRKTTRKILLTAGYKQSPPFDYAEYFMKFDNLNRAYEWDGMLDSLIPFRQGVTLSQVEVIDIYSGRLNDTGTFWIWFGYRLADGMIVYNADIILNFGSSHKHVSAIIPTVCGRGGGVKFDRK